MPKQMMMMEPGDEFVTMDRRNQPGRVKMWQVLDDGAVIPIGPVPRDYVEPPDAGPHSRACGIKPHPHGEDCSPDCPTCQGRS